MILDIKDIISLPKSRHLVSFLVLRDILHAPASTTVILISQKSLSPSC